MTDDKTTVTDNGASACFLWTGKTDLIPFIKIHEHMVSDVVKHLFTVRKLKVLENSGLADRLVSVPPM